MPLKHCGATPLHQAALRGHNEMCEFLLDHGADIDARDDEFNAPPIGWANETGSQETVELLARRGTSLTLMLAAACGLTEKVREILARDPGSLNRSGGYGTALHAAAVWGGWKSPNS